MNRYRVNMTGIDRHTGRHEALIVFVTAATKQQAKAKAFDAANDAGIMVCEMEEPDYQGDPSTASVTIVSEHGVWQGVTA